MTRNWCVSLRRKGSLCNELVLYDGIFPCNAMIRVYEFVALALSHFRYRSKTVANATTKGAIHAYTPAEIDGAAPTSAEVW